MRVQGVLLASALTVVFAAGLGAAENASAIGVSHDAQLAFRSGDYKKAAKLFEKAVQLEPANADYRESLGRAYERQAEASSFPLLLTAKARKNYVRALQLQPDHAGAIVDLIELNQQPIGLCEGDLTEAARLIDRLSQLDPAAAKHAREYLADARLDAARPGQKALCGPVKLSRVITNHLLPNPTFQASVPVQTDIELAEASASAAGSN